MAKIETEILSKAVSKPVLWKRYIDYVFSLWNMIKPDQEKMRGQRGRLPVHPLGYVMSTKVIFRRAEVIVLAEVCLPRRPHVTSQP